MLRGHGQEIMTGAPEIARRDAGDQVGLDHRVQIQLPDHAPFLVGLRGGRQHANPRDMPAGTLVMQGDELVSVPAEQVAGGDAAQRVPVVPFRRVVASAEQAPGLPGEALWRVQDHKFDTLCRRSQRNDMLLPHRLRPEIADGDSAGYHLLVRLRVVPPTQQPRAVLHAQGRLVNRQRPLALLVLLDRDEVAEAEAPVLWPGERGGCETEDTEARDDPCQAAMHGRLLREVDGPATRARHCFLDRFAHLLLTLHGSGRIAFCVGFNSRDFLPAETGVKHVIGAFSLVRGLAAR